MAIIAFHSEYFSVRLWLIFGSVQQLGQASVHRKHDKH